MQHKQAISTRRIVFTALMAALTMVSATLRIRIPITVGGQAAFHLGNTLCALDGILLGPWLGGLASGLGSALYDILLEPAYMSECWITFLTKGAYGLVAGLVMRSLPKKWGVYLKALAATVAGAVTYAVLYLSKSYFYSGMLMQGLSAETAWLGVVGKLPATAFNAAVAIIGAPLLAVAIRKALDKSHLSI
ncbi:MAG: ECF transporter S component [Oscillospiraceae bacterium]|nr:ECF transporter S component [Oscillospiraceae bacterium]